MIILGQHDENFYQKPIIILANFSSTPNMTPEKMNEEMQKSLQQQNNDSGTKLEVVTTKHLVINSSESILTISEGTTKNGVEYRQWLTSCPGKTGVVMIMIQGPSKYWDEPTYNKLLASLNSNP